MNRNHLSEEALVLHLYGEAEDARNVEKHLESCPRCREELALLRQVLAEVDEMPLPERGDDYGARVWGRVEPRLARESTGPERGRSFRLAYGLAAAAVLLLGTFLAGRLSAPVADVIERDVEPLPVRERILLVALSEHLEESQMLLLEAVNRTEPSVVPLDRERAADLLQASRLYRQTALGQGDPATAGVLEELERLLLDVSQGPDSVEAQEAWKRRIEERDLLFKLRVLETSARRRGTSSAVKKF